jgi:hypothetical protein
MCLNETYSKVRVGKIMSVAVPIQNDLKNGDRKVQHRMEGRQMKHMSSWSVLMMLIYWLKI